MHIMNKYSKACRICISEDGIKIPIFGESGRYRHIAEKIKECLNITVYEQDPLPKQICHHCYGRLTMSFDLKQESQRTHTIFVNYLSAHRGNEQARSYLRVLQDRALVNTPLEREPLKRKGGDTATLVGEGPPVKRPTLEEPALGLRRAAPSRATSSPKFLSAERRFDLQLPKCQVCELTFTNKKQLSMHETTQHTKEEFEAAHKFDYACNICGRGFETAKNLKIHSIKHHKIRLSDVSAMTREFSSSERDTESPSTFSLPEIKTERFEEPVNYRCHICYGVFSGERALDQHCQLEHRDIGFEDSQLHKTAGFQENQSEIPDQVEEELPDAKPECVICFQTFKNNSGLVNHLRTAHGKPSCTLCLEIFGTQEELAKHRSEVHRPLVPSASPSLTAPQDAVAVGESQDVFQCDVCGKSFDRDVSLLRHKANHTWRDNPAREEKRVTPTKDVLAAEEEAGSEDSLQCSLCDEVFDRRVSLIRHKAAHSRHGPAWVPVAQRTSSKKFTCPTCGKSFDRHVSYIRHQAHHREGAGSGSQEGATQHANSGVYNVEDEEGNDEASESSEDDYKAARRASGVSSTNLSQNRGEVPYCLYCKKVLGSNMKLWEHVRQAHPSRERYKCPHNMCGRVFFSKLGYKSHLTTHKQTDNDSTTLAENKETKPTEAFISSEKQAAPPKVPYCEICEKPLSSWNNLKRHWLDQHPAVPRFDCSDCTRFFKTKQELTAHEQKGHFKSKNLNVHPKVLCRYCPKYLSSKYITDHEKIHRRAGHRPQRHGARGAEQPPPLKAEESTSKSNPPPQPPPPAPPPPPIENPPETGEDNEKVLAIDSPLYRARNKKACCKFCDSVYPSFENLRKHLSKMHCGKIYYLCSQCPEVYFDPTGLKVHNIRHTRLYTKCKHCERPFAYMTYLQQHEKTCNQRPEASGSSSPSPSTSASPAPAAAASGGPSVAATRSSSNLGPAPASVQARREARAAGSAIYTCDFCGSQFLDTQAFVKHLQGHASSA